MTNNSFLNQYNQILKIIEPNIENYNSAILKFFQQDFISQNPAVPIIKDFFFSKSKKLRPALIFLFANALYENENDYNFFVNLAVINEFLHNASLIHDDIIDCSINRRGHHTINFEYDSKLAVLTGDYLLSCVFDFLASIENKEIRKIHSQAVSNIINGELIQYFSRFKLLTIEKYIEKSKNKTARLFEAGILSTYIYKNTTKQHLKEIQDFALNFGIGFQIINDLNNFSDAQKLEEDLNNGDYSAPVIYYVEENYNGDISKIKNTKQLAKSIINSNAMNKTKQLAQNYFNKAIENISFIEDNQYKIALIKLCKLFAN